MRWYALVLVLLGISIAGYAQRDGRIGQQRALELIEPYRRALAKPIETLDESFSLTTFGAEGQIGQKWTGRVVIDFVHRRAVIESFEKKGELAERTVILTDTGFVIDSERDRTRELAASELAVYNQMFIGAARNFLPLNLGSLKYEPNAKYADIVEGQQIVSAPLPGSPRTLLSNRIVFDREGRVIAVVSEQSTKPQLQITRLKEPASPDEFPKFVNNTIYTVDRETGKVDRVAERQVEDFSVNQPVDEALFKIE
jgi:hypothetical protein